jgi:hypothetical protein
MVVVEKLSKATHFIPIKSTLKAINVEEIFMKEIFKLHGIPTTIIFDRLKFYINILEMIVSRIG